MPDIPLRLRKIMSRGIEFETGPIITGRSFQGMKIEPGIAYSRGSKINIGPTGKTTLSRGQEIPIGPQISEAEAVFRARQGVTTNKSITQKNNESYSRLTNERDRYFQEPEKRANKRGNEVIEIDKHIDYLRDQTLNTFDAHTRKTLCQKIVDECDKVISMTPYPIDFFTKHYYRVLSKSNFYWQKEFALTYAERYDEAVETCKMAILIEKDNRFYEKKVESLLMLSRFNEAIVECDKGIYSHKNNLLNTREYFTKKFTHYKSEALNGLEISKLPNKDAANKWFDLGLKATDERDAIRYFSKVLQLDPKNSAAWNKKGVALSNLHRHGKAIECYNKALEINPENETAKNNKISALKKLTK